MKRSSFRRRSAFFSSPGRVVAVASGAVLALAFVIRLAWPGAFFTLATQIFSVGNALATISGEPVSEEVRANETLVNENIALAARVADLERLLGEEPEARDGIVAGVVARPPMAPYDTLIVGAGSAAGVASNMHASAEGGVPLGTVEMVTKNHAQIALFSTAGRATDGWAGEDRVPVTLLGKGAGAFTAKIPRDAHINENDFVYVPGPGARPIGRIVRVDADPSSPSAELRIEPLVNIFSLTDVLIEPAL